MAPITISKMERELRNIKEKDGIGKQYKVLQCSQASLEILLLPDRAPYKRGAFRVEMNLPPEYPNKPPKINFKTKIYHPNVDENGQVSLQLVKPEHWKPAFHIEQVLQALVIMLHNPVLSNTLRWDLADQHQKNKRAFLKEAEDFTKKHGEARPCN